MRNRHTCRSALRGGSALMSSHKGERMQPPTFIVMVFQGFATEGMDPLKYQDFIGQYVKSYSIEAYDGRGDVTFTDDIMEAARWPDLRHAMATWQQVSRLRPRRPDGKPNRPLTAMTVSFESVAI